MPLIQEEVFAQIHTKLPIDQKEIIDRYAHKLNMNRSRFVANLVRIGMQEYLRDEANTLNKFKGD